MSRPWRCRMAALPNPRPSNIEYCPDDRIQTVDFGTTGFQLRRMTRPLPIVALLIGIFGILVNANAGKPVTTGEAKGMLITEGNNSFALNHATAFVDQREEHKPIVL